MLSNLLFNGVKIETFNKTGKWSKKSLRLFGSSQWPLPLSLVADVAPLPAWPLIIITFVHLCIVWRSHIFFLWFGDNLVLIHCSSFIQNPQPSLSLFYAVLLPQRLKKWISKFSVSLANKVYQVTQFWPKGSRKERTFSHEKAKPCEEPFGPFATLLECSCEVRDGAAICDHEKINIRMTNWGR